MKILALDTSNFIASASLFEDAVFIDERILKEEKHSSHVPAIIDDLLKANSISIDDIGQFCVCLGPGSFTGIRIGVTTIKVIAQVLEKKVIGVTSLSGLLHISGQNNTCGIIDAKHDNVYAQYKIEGRIYPPQFINIEDLLKELSEFNSQITFSGDGTLVHENKISLNKKFSIFDKREYLLSSDLVYASIKEDIEAVSPFEIVPVYLRKSQAER